MLGCTWNLAARHPGLRRIISEGGKNNKVWSYLQCGGGGGEVAQSCLTLCSPMD